MGIAALCHHHHVKLPDVETCNRVCIHFEPTTQYWRDNGTEMPPARRFTWFREDLQPRILYVFHYNAPTNIVDRISVDSLTDIGNGTT